MNYDNSKRGYLLPGGCKDLLDALKLSDSSEQNSSLPPITEVLALPNVISAQELAVSVNRKPFQLIADLMTLGVFAALDHPLDFDTASKVARKFRPQDGQRFRPKGQKATFLLPSSIGSRPQLCWELARS
jgi:hypothetical protein